jgi:hypothetical protein
MRTATIPAVLLVLLAAGCGATAPTRTTLIGTVLRGPVQPVCRVDVSCEAPFSAGFTVRQGDRVIASFTSDAAGHFELSLASGTYLVVADADAPILSPRTQTKEVTVGATGPATVLLHFDTGLR